MFSHCAEDCSAATVKSLQFTAIRNHTLQQMHVILGLSEDFGLYFVFLSLRPHRLHESKLSFHVFANR